MSSRPIKLGAFLHGFGHHQAGWRHPQTDIAQEFSFAHYARLAQTAERGFFDMVFLADSTGIRDWDLDALSHTARAAVFEPVTLLAALSVVTKHVGLVATASTSYNEPYTIARKFASIDMLSEGRAGWNLVTSTTESEAMNFHLDRQTPHGDRYQRASEFADVVMGLWDSWAPDAFPRDKASGRYFDPKGLRFLHHRGAHFGVRGPLNAPRSVQGRPIIVQAGSSEDGKALAARTADVVFTAQPTLAAASTFYADLKCRMAQHGRTPDTLKIMPGLLTIVGATEAEARQKFADLQGLIHPSVGIAQLSELLGRFDLSPYPVDGPLPEIPETTGGQSRRQVLVDMARRENLSIRQLYERTAAARGFLMAIGTASQIADTLEQWVDEDGADGFNLMPPVMPGDLDDFVDQVVPELQRRGRVRREYEGTTLRQNLGLALPASAHD
ncbi:LLM class flavin-dependent oxidoreductase [Humitalea sp. 24SJ18S-53]|uniref:LLM class flavin-dependent oxidoreductase n=1 Tax=Humitalea sp. 24SJ18S-53 TaxID=3422307 RepID=UPI003D66B8EB